MTFVRSSIQDFALANAYYALATVTVYTVDDDGDRTTTLAPLYENVVGSTQLTNPQVLDSEGKFVRPVYVDRDVIAVVTGRTVATHETGVIVLPVFSDYATDTFTGDGTETAFTLSHSCQVASFLDVVIDGARQQPDTAYTVSGTTLTFTEAPPDHSAIFVVHSATPAAYASGFVPMLGDVTGSSAANTVTKIQNIAVSTTDPATGEVLKFNGTAWAPAADAGLTSVTLAGDVTGGSGANTVAKIQNISVSTTDPTLGQVLAYDGTNWTPAASSVSSSLLEGDSDKFTSGQCGVLVPFYVYPNNPYTDPVVEDFLDMIRRYRRVPVIVVINPSNGPGAVEDGNYSAFIKLCQAAGAKVAGYVATGYAATPEATVKADVDAWLTLYADTPIDTIFFDEQTYDLGVGNANVLLYQRYKTYCHDRSLWPVIANPGTNQQTAYFEAPGSADIIVVHENSTWPSEATLWGNYVGGHVDFKTAMRAVLVYDQATLDPDQVRMAAKHAQYLYISNDDLPNPWDTVSGLLDQTMAILHDAVPIGGSSGQYLTKSSGTDYDADWTTLDLTSYAPLASPTFTGVPAAPTASAGTSTTQLATTAFVTTADNLKADLASPTFTGTVTAPTFVASNGWPYDLPLYIPDSPTSSMVCVRIVAVRAFSLPASLTGSVASAGVAATASTVFDIHKNASSVGSITFAIGATTGTFTFASLTSWASGDVLRVIAPATPDATLADISITFLGTRT